MKTCTKCEAEKIVAAFPKKGGQCKACRNEYLKKWIKTDKGKEYRRKSRKKHKARIAAERKRYNDSPTARTKYLKYKYGVTHDDYEKKKKMQGNVCAICGREQGYKRLAVDHNHATNQIRGLLCERCNLGLGSFKEDVESMAKAITYIVHYNKIHDDLKNRKNVS